MYRWTLGRAKGRARRRLLRLVFASRAVRRLDREELDDLAVAANHRNAAEGLTGLLVCQGLRFASVLEGPEAGLIERMDAIAADPRHGQLRILREQTITERRFRNWRLFVLPEIDAGSRLGLHATDFILDLAKRLD